MPTGYTAPIYEGEKDFDFNKFVMRCARNFGAMMEFRDEPLNSEVDFDKHFQPSEYNNFAVCIRDYNEKFEKMLDELSDDFEGENQFAKYKDGLIPSI